MYALPKKGKLDREVSAHVPCSPGLAPSDYSLQKSTGYRDLELKKVEKLSH